MRIGAYPGTFNPPTIAHLAIAEAARDQCGLDRVDLVMARRPLAKDPGHLVALEDRVAVLEAAAGARPGLRAVVSDGLLIVDIVAGYDMVVMGADKWSQVADPVWYGDDPARRDAAVARLPRLAVAPRAGTPPAALALPDDAVVLDLHQDHRTVSATAARAGRHEWMAPEARQSGLWPMAR